MYIYIYIYISIYIYIYITLVYNKLHMIYMFMEYMYTKCNMDNVYSCMGAFGYSIE